MPLPRDLAPFTMPRASCCRHRAGFTLIELLTVIAVVGVLAALMFPAAAAVSRRGKTTTCLSNLREIGSATQLHVLERQGRLPGTSHLRADDGTSLSWTVTLAAYLGPTFLGRCPAVPEHPSKVTYAWNDLLTSSSGEGLRLGDCQTPALTFAVGEIAPSYTTAHFHFADAARGRVTPAFFKSMVNVECHGNASNFLFLDGHAQTLAWPEIQRRLGTDKSPFLWP